MTAGFRSHFHAGAEPEQEGEARPNGKAAAGAGVTIDDFVAHMPSHNYIFLPSREPWPGSSVNARLPPVGKQTAAAWLDQHRPVEQTTWAPGEPMLIRDRLISDGGWVARPGCAVLNLYRPPTLAPRLGLVDRWLDHIHRVFPEEADHIVRWLAMRVQRPDVKINHALVLGSSQGIGKDTILEPVKQAIGPWNFAEVSPQQVVGRFNGFFKSVILRVSEARDLGDVDRFSFYDHMKTLTAAPPDVLRVDEKFLREYYILNVCGVVITSNHKAIFLPPDDRRHFVAWSDLTRDDFADDYWRKMYAWFDNGGTEAVAAHLHGLDLADFDPKAPPPKTPAFWEIVNASRAPENSEIADALDKLGRPNAVTLTMIKNNSTSEFTGWLNERKNARKVPHRLEECGYLPVRNPDADDGLWRIDGRRQAIYARREVAPHDRHRAAEAMR